MNILKHLEVVCDNAATLSPEEFTLIRKNGLGASDASIYLGLMNKWRTRNDLISEKLRLTATEDEIAIGQKEAVRKGTDLEPLILQKFIDATGLECSKPQAMYRLKNYPYLTVNFDGITEIGDQLIPVECKFVSKYGGKYWNREQRIDPTQPLQDTGKFYMDSSDMWENLHMSYGPPAYYIAQIQQQMLALDAPYGFFSVMFDDGWCHEIYKVQRHSKAQQELIVEAYKVWNEIQALRK